MYAESEINEDVLSYQQPERTSDIQLPPIINTLLLVAWVAIFLAGLAVIYLVKSPLLGALIIAIPTFIGMVIKPTFALCTMMLVLPTGTGIAIPGVFTLDRGVGIALAVSFLLNLMISRPSLHIRNKALWVLVIYTIWIFFSSLAAPSVGLELKRASTQFQLLALVFIIYWILQTNGEKTFRWALRAYVIGTLGTITIAYISGAAMVAIEETEITGGRYAATLGQIINSNMLAALTGLAFLAAIYLFARDRNILWRIVYLIAISFLPLMLLRMGSRGALVAMAFTLLSPLLFIRQILRRPALAALLLVIILLASVSAALLVKKKGLETRVAHRLTDIQYAKSSIGYRLMLNEQAVKCAIKYPAGTGYFGWFVRTGAEHWPHNDFFLALGVYGIPGALLFTLLIVAVILTVKQTPLGAEKLFGRAILTFLLVMGLSMAQLYQKQFWVFLAFVMAAERIGWLHIGKEKLLNPKETEELHSVSIAY